MPNNYDPALLDSKDQFMFNLFTSNPSKKLQSKLAKLYEEAMHTQRSGDLKKYAFQMEAIAKLEKELEVLRTQKN